MCSKPPPDGKKVGYFTLTSPIVGRLQPIYYSFILTSWDIPVQWLPIYVAFAQLFQIHKTLLQQANKVFNLPVMSRGPIFSTCRAL